MPRKTVQHGVKWKQTTADEKWTVTNMGEQLLLGRLSIQSESISFSPRRVGIEQSTTKGVNPKPTSLIEQVTMSIYMAPETASWNSLAENIVDHATHIGSCSLANSGGMHITTQGKLSPCRGLVISTNPGGGVFHQLLVSSCCNSAFWVGAGDGLAAWVVVVGFDCLTLQATTNNPLAQALWFLQQLHSQRIAGSTGSDILEHMTLTQLEGGASSRISASVNMVRGSMACWSSSTLSAS